MTFTGDVNIQLPQGQELGAYMLTSLPPKDRGLVNPRVHAGKGRIPTEVAARVAGHPGERDLTLRSKSGFAQTLHLG
jgi:hypothetical protein